MRLICACLLLSIGVASAQTTTSAPVILVFGDSVSAGYGIRVEQGWVSLLQQRLKTQGYGYRVVNASVSGETTAGGLARLPRALSVHKPAVVVLELGGNDGLRALPLAQMRDNLQQMVDLSIRSGAQVLLVGMRVPPNYGPAYTQQFYAVFGELTKDAKLPLVPFLLDHVALDPALMQEDRIHPNAQGQPRLLENVWPALRKILHKA